MIYLDGALPWRPWDIVKRVWEWVKELLEDLRKWFP